MPRKKWRGTFSVGPTVFGVPGTMDILVRRHPVPNLCVVRCKNLTQDHQRSTHKVSNEASLKTKSLKTKTPWVFGMCLAKATVASITKSGAENRQVEIPGCLPVDLLRPRGSPGKLQA